jgi:hypothetical protein
MRSTWPRALLPLLLVCAGLSTSLAATPRSAPGDTLLTVAETEFHLLPPGAEHAALAHAYIVPGTLSAHVNGHRWEYGVDYRVDGTRGWWIPLRPLPDAGDGDVLVRLSYRFRPVPVPAQRVLHPVRGRPLLADDGRSPLDWEPTKGPPPAMGDLDVSGSKSVRMSSGNRRDMTIDQTLRLNIAGWLTEDIHVNAALSDDNLPVVPEGNTEELRDIDRMRVELTAPRWHAVLGDFVASREGSVYGGYRRKLQGVVVDGGTERVGAGAMAGSPRGIYRTLQLRGEESNQGPYFLGGGETGAQVFIVAGSERVTVDGAPMTRGADRDYVIDYVRGTVTFTYRRLITAESEILVEYEAGEGPFARTVVGGEGRYTGIGVLPGDRDVAVAVRLTREQDNPDRPRSGELSAADLALLAAAGDDPDAAITSGLTQVTAGDGTYRLEMQGGVQIAVHDTLAGDYEVEFRFVGSGLGEYDVEALTATGERIYAYRGVGLGAYAIGRPLALPGRQSLASVQAVIGAHDDPLLDLEWHASNRDDNVLSGVGDADDTGHAWRAALDAGEGALVLGGLALGRVRAHAIHDDLGAGFRPFQLARDMFRYDRWGLGDRARHEGFLQERDVETRVGAGFVTGDEARRLDVEATWGRLEHGESLSARRLQTKGDWRLGPARGSSRWAEAQSEDLIDPLDVQRSEQSHTVSIAGGFIVPSAGLVREQYRDDAAQAATSGGYRLRAWQGALSSASAAALSWQVGFQRGLADSLRDGQWRGARDSRTTSWRLGTPVTGGVRLQADGVVRDVIVPGGADLTTRLAKVQLSGRWDRTGSDWGLIYGIDNSRTEVLDRQVVYIGERQGDYNQNGDFVGHQLGDFNVVTVGTDSLVATTEVTADFTWRQNFNFLGRDRIWGAWQTFTRVTARSRSRTDDVERLLRFAEDTIFDGDDTVLGELALRQEATLLRHLQRWDLRLLYDYSQALDRQYATHPERRLRHHSQITLSWNPTQRTSLRARTQRTDEARATEESAFSANRSYAVDTWRQELEWLVQPGAGNRAAVAVDVVARDDATSGVSQREYGLKPSARVRLERRWSGLAEFRWFRVESDEPAGALRPFFFAEPGVNVEASARLSWEPSTLLTVSLAYFGRKLGERGWQHDVRLESTARF